MLRSFEQLPPSADSMSFPTDYLPPTEQQQRQQELANAEAALAEAVRAFDAARAGIGEANRTSTAPITSSDRVLMPALRYSPERIREWKSYAFRLFNQRRGQVAAARRRVEAARAALGLPTLASLEERAVTREAVQASKRVPVTPIASTLTA